MEMCSLFNIAVKDFIYFKDNELTKTFCFEISYWKKSI